MAEPATRFFLQRAATRAGPIALVTIDNGADWTKPNTFGPAALESLAEVLGRLRTRDWRGLVLTGKPFVFAAGADMTQFPGITRERALEGSRAGHELFLRLRDLPFPTVAAINGACVGGGVEIALHCDVRTISTAVRHFASPECLLGLIPAWGGTQLIPRLVGAETAVRFVVENPMNRNRMLTGAKAFELGFADHLLEPVEFLDSSLALAMELAERGLEHRDEADLSDAAEVVRKARLRLDDSVHGAAPAPYRALDLIEGAATWSLEEGYRQEEDAVADLLPGPQAQASLYAFELVERRAKRGVGIPAVEPRPIRKVGIVGAGLMASQLAGLFLRRLEVPVVMRDLTDEQVATGVEAARGMLEGPKAPFLSTLVSGATDWAVLEGCDLVLEAVFEELDVKKEVFAAVEAVVSPECMLATNTSSLSVTTMGSDLEHAERLLGMHFFNPVALLPLVELVRTRATDDATLAIAADVAKRLRKTGVLVRDAPAFVVNRVLTRMTTVLLDALEQGNSVEEIHDAILEALADEIGRLLDDGVVAEAADVDTCLILGAGFPFFLGGITPHLDAAGVSERVTGRRFARRRELAPT